MYGVWACQHWGFGWHSDVPGMTQAVIPTLLEHGVKGVSVGVNTASAPPAVPPGFVW